MSVLYVVSLILMSQIFWGCRGGQESASAVSVHYDAESIYLAIDTVWKFQIDIDSGHLVRNANFWKARNDRRNIVEVLLPAMRNHETVYVGYCGLLDISLGGLAFIVVVELYDIPIRGKNGVFAGGYPDVYGPCVDDDGRIFSFEHTPDEAYVFLKKYFNGLPPE